MDPFILQETDFFLIQLLTLYDLRKILFM